MYVIIVWGRRRVRFIVFIQSGNVVFEKHLECSSDNARVFIDYYASEIVELTKFLAYNLKSYYIYTGD